MVPVRPPLSASIIVDEALALIRESSVDALSMRTLAARLGVSAPALYAHVDGRTSLLRATAQVGYDQLETRFLEDSGPTAIDMIWSSSRSYVRFALDEPQLFALIFLFRPSAIGIESEPGVDIEHSGATSVFDRMLENIQRAIDDGALRRAEPIEYGLALWASVHGVATVAAMTPGLDIDSLLDRVVGGLLDGWSR